MMKFIFKLQQHPTDAVESTIAPLSNLVSLPYEND